MLSMISREANGMDDRALCGSHEGADCLVILVWHFSRNPFSSDGTSAGLTACHPGQTCVVPWKHKETYTEEINSRVCGPWTWEIVWEGRCLPNMQLIAVQHSPSSTAREAQLSHIPNVVLEQEAQEYWHRGQGLWLYSSSICYLCSARQQHFPLQWLRRNLECINSQDALAAVQDQISLLSFLLFKVLIQSPHLTSSLSAISKIAHIRNNSSFALNTGLSVYMLE